MWMGKPAHLFCLFILVLGGKKMLGTSRGFILYSRWGLSIYSYETLITIKFTILNFLGIVCSWRIIYYTGKFFDLVSLIERHVWWIPFERKKNVEHIWGIPILMSDVIFWLRWKNHASAELLCMCVGLPSTCYLTPPLISLHLLLRLWWPCGDITISRLSSVISKA